MHHSKLLQLLKLLSESEFKRLKLFITSPFFSTNPHTLKLYNVLRKDYPYFLSQSLKKEKVFQKLFPKQPYHHQKLLNLMSELSGLVKQFLQLLQLESDKPLQRNLLLRALAKRPLAYQAFEKEYNKADRKLERRPYRDRYYFQQKFLQQQLYYNHPATDRFALLSDNYARSLEQLDQWIILEKLSISCEMKAREKSLSETYDIWLLADIRQKAVDYLDSNPIMGAYLEMLDLMEKETPAHYHQLKKILWDHFPDFSRTQQQQIIQCLINYTIQQGNKGDAAFLQENLELYQVGLTAGLFLEHGTLNDMQFISMVNISLRTGATQWCLQLIEQFEELLDPRARKDAVTLAKALWFYQINQGDAAIRLLQEVDFLNVYYQVQSRVLLLKTYYELFHQDHSYFELINSQTEAFERYLRRNTHLAENKKEGLLNLVMAVKKLIRLQMEVNPAEQERIKMKKSVEQQLPFYNKAWFLKQIT